MPQITINNCAGLYVQQNSFTTPDGAMERLLNVVCKNDQMAIGRRGYQDYYTAATYSTQRDASAVTEYLDRIFVAEETQLTIFNPVLGDGRSAMTDTSSLWSITKGSRPFFAKANGNMYATTANGILKIESTTADIRKAGIPNGLDLTITTAITDGTTLFPVNSQVGYRIVFGRTDANFNKVVGAPSEFTTATNVVINDAVATNPAGNTINVLSVAHGLTTGDLVTTTDGKNGAGTSQPTMNITSVSVTRIDNDNFTYTATGAVAGMPGTVDWSVKKTINLNFTVPADALSTEFFYQIYRTDFTSAQTVSPLESTLQLIYEANLSASEVSNKVVSFDDTIDDIFKNGFLYTNPNTGVGILQANNPPPFADDITTFNNMILYANTKTKYRLAVGLISTTSLSGNTFKVTTTNGTLSYTGAAAENIGAREFLVSATGTTSQKIAATAKSLCRVINRDATSDVVAYYVSAADGVPGKFVLESKSFTIGFYINVGNAAIAADFQPVLATSGTTIAGVNSDEPNALYPSKAGEQEAVPLTNKIYVGAKTSEILRIVPLRDTCLVITETGVYGVRGDSPTNISVSLIDNTVICKSKNSVQVINNECYFVSNQGVVACSETSVRVVSIAIAPLISSVLGNTYFDQFTKACGYESEHLYILGTLAPNTAPVTVTDTPTTASITSKIATLNFSSDVDSIVVGNSIVISGMTGTLTPLNGTFTVLSISATAITFYVNNANVAAASASGSTLTTIGQNVVYVYNLVSNRWSQWDTYFIDGIVRSTDDKMVLIKDSCQISLERKLFNNLDYTDNAYGVLVTSVGSDELTATVDLHLYWPNVAFEAGDALVDLSGNVNIIDSVDATDGITLNFRTAVSFGVSDSLYYYKSIEHDIVTAPLTAGDVSRFKFFSEFQAVFRTQSCRHVDVSFSSNATIESEPETWESEILSGFGQLPFGAFDFGLGNSTELVLTTQASENVRTVVPSSCSRSTWIQARLNHRRATEGFDLQSFAYRVRAYGPRVGS